jgi:ABC-type glutathione transport system ATPase component
MKATTLLFAEPAAQRLLAEASSGYNSMSSDVAEDIDVAAERRRVMNDTHSSRTAIIIKNLHKVRAIAPITLADAGTGDLLLLLIVVCCLLVGVQTFPPKISTASAQKGTDILSAVRGLCESPEPYVAVHDLCLAMEYGECFGLLGPNGSGKTTTIKCVLSVQMWLVGSWAHWIV